MPPPLELELFTAGKRPDAHGVTVEITPADLRQVVESYDPSTFRAPLFVKPELSHNTEGVPDAEFADSPWCHGIPSKLKLKGKTLVGEFDKHSAKLKRWIGEGRIPGFSASFYRPQSPSNPYPGKFALRHVAAVLHPAVKGLGMPGFSEPEFAEATEFGRMADFGLEPVSDFLDFGCSGGCSCQSGAIPSPPVMPMNHPTPTLEAVMRPLRDHLIESLGVEKANQVLPEFPFRAIDQAHAHEIQAMHEKVADMHEQLAENFEAISELRLQLTSLRQDLAMQGSQLDSAVDRVDGLVSEVMGDAIEDDLMAADLYDTTPLPTYSEPITLEGAGWVRGRASNGDALDFLRGQIDG